MKDVFTKLIEALKNTNGPTRVVIGAALALLGAIAGVASYRAANPHLTLLKSGLDEAQLAAASSAIANAGIRFKTSHGPGPYTIWVDESLQYQALNAIYLDGALSADPRGIDASSSGAVSAFLGSGERRQQMYKRKWQEVEKMLEVYNWIARATVASSNPNRSPLSRSESETISVVLQLRGALEPSREQRDTVARIVSSAFGVERSQVVVSDQYGRTVFDGSRDRAFDDILQFQTDYESTLLREAQSALDETYGVGMALAKVHSEWTYDRIESIDEGVDPATKAAISKRTFDSTTPGVPATNGGAVGTDANNLGGTPATSAPPKDAKTKESQENYLFSRSTVHTLQATPILRRLTVTLLMDESLAEELPKAAEWVKGIVGFDEARGDTFASNTARFNGLERDEEGNIVPPEPEPLPAPPNAMVEMLIDRGVEIVAALGFLMVLLKSLKKSAQPPVVESKASEDDKPTIADEDIDVGLLAREQVADLLAKDPERVSAILSRWALDDSFATSK